MKPVNKLVLLSKSKVAGRYMIHYLLPLLIAVTVTFLTVRYVNNFIRTQNEHFSEAIVSQLQQDLNDIISEAEQVALAYTTNLYFFDQLDTILASGNVSISQLETLRTLERNVTITQAVRPHIYSIYFCPEANDTGAFLVAQDGIAYLNTYYDADFIRQARGAAADGLTLRGIKRGTALHTSFLTYVAHTTKSMISRVAGTVILNMDVRSIQKMLAAYTGERTDDLFLITYGGEAVFGSRLLLDADDVALDGDTQTLGGEEYHLTAQARDDRGFAYRIYATHASLYSSGNLLVAINLAVMFCFLALGMFVVWYISKERYRDYIRAGDFVRKLDDMGSRMMGKEVYVARYEDMQNYIQLHLSENELKERTLELETLRHQLNPHLLLNTLQTMNWRLIREFGGHTEVNVTIENLCRILSYTLYPADTLARIPTRISRCKAISCPKTWRSTGRSPQRRARCAFPGSFFSPLSKTPASMPSRKRGISRRFSSPCSKTATACASPCRITAAACRRTRSRPFAPGWGKRRRATPASGCTTRTNASSYCSAAGTG